MSHTRKIKNIFVAGAGPIGLYVAIQLKKLIDKYNLKINVIVVDNKIEKRTRPGIIADKAAQTIETNLGIKLNLKNPVPGAVFIAELENGLYKEALKMQIEFKAQHFKEFSGSSVKLSEDKTSYPCDLIFDCTGQTRAIVNAVNKIDPTNFTETQVADNPLPNHFLAYVKMDEKDYVNSTKDSKNFLKYVLQLEELRVKYEWNNFDTPSITSGKWQNSATDTFFNASYYFEIPQTMATAETNKQESFLKSFLKLKSGLSIDFKRDEENLLKFTPFEVNPKQVAPFCLSTANFPSVVPCGDAQISPDYRLGHGIESGVNRFNAFVTSLTLIPNNTFVLNEKKYATLLEPLLKQHADLIKKEYEYRANKIHAALEKAKELYEKALTEAKNEEEKFTIETGILIIYAKMIPVLLKKITKLTRDSAPLARSKERT